MKRSIGDIILGNHPPEFAMSKRQQNAAAKAHGRRTMKVTPEVAKAIAQQGKQRGAIATSSYNYDGASHAVYPAGGNMETHVKFDNSGNVVAQATIGIGGNPWG